mmetsp:Transcript_62929/g.172827  ORF Transcript_62929/g.172827 Transcript_62929/m.172827 type:complete len:420 (+) Transcript_62929:219-1478(+)
MPKAGHGAATPLGRWSLCGRAHASSTLACRYGQNERNGTLLSMPHSPDPVTRYKELVAVAQSVQRDNLVLLTASDYSHRELVANWAAHAHRQRVHNYVVLAMDRPMARTLAQWCVPSFDNTANIQGWQRSRLWPLARVMLERVLAGSALLMTGLDVLYIDVDCLILHDFRPFLASLKLVDIVTQRDVYPANAAGQFASLANALFDGTVPLSVDGVVRWSSCTGFMLFRSSAGSVRFMDDVLALANSNFFHTNAVDQVGLNEALRAWEWKPSFLHEYSYARRSTRPAPRTMEDMLVIGKLQGWPDEACASHTPRPKCSETLVRCSSKPTAKRPCLTFGLLPYRLFPRDANWSAVRRDALVMHGLKTERLATGSPRNKISALKRHGLWQELREVRMPRTAFDASSHRCRTRRTDHSVHAPT